MKTTTKDFFIQLAAMVTLYAGTIALLNLLFRAINVLYPQVGRYFFAPPISLPVATLIVVFPLYLLFSNVLQKSYTIDPSKKESAVRKWLIYITLFIAGFVVVGDLITLIYYFLDGRELTAGFMLKVLSVLVVTGSIFGYYFDDLRNRLTGTRRNAWRAVSAILVIGSIILGFSVIGSPRTQRLMRYDEQKTSDLQNIQWQVVNHWQQKGTLPNSLSELNDPISGWMAPSDPQGKTYTYKKTGNTSFELCADFNKPSQSGISSQAYPYGKPLMEGNENWNHGLGSQCFQRTIDPQLYPVRPVR